MRCLADGATFDVLIGVLERQDHVRGAVPAPLATAGKSRPPSGEALPRTSKTVPRRMRVSPSGMTSAQRRRLDIEHRAVHEHHPCIPSQSMRKAGCTSIPVRDQCLPGREPHAQVAWAPAMR